MTLRQAQGDRDSVRQFIVGEDDAGSRLDRWFKRHLPQIGFGTVSKWARTGQIRIDGKRAKPEDRLVAGQQIRVPPGGETSQREAKAKRELTQAEIAEARGMLIAQNAAALVFNKPPGLATQGGTKTHSHIDGLLDAFIEGDGPRPRLVHRLDKDTSGVLLVARTPGSAAFFSKRFASRSARKVYWALVVGVPEVREGTIDAALAKQPGTGGEKMHVDHEGGQPAKTKYRVVDKVSDKAAWLELEPLTGRTHQLRVHCAAMGHPIVGDGKYGGKDAFLTGSVSRKMHLHARRLIIDSPDGETIDATAELPEHFAASMEQLGFDLSLSEAEPLRGASNEKSREEKKQAARAHAKQYRKERKGERRSRGASDKPAQKLAGKPTGKSKPKTKPSPKPKASPKPSTPSRPPAKPRGRP